MNLEIQEVERLLRSRLTVLFIHRDFDPRSQNLDDVVQECLLVLLVKKRTDRPYVLGVARIAFARMIERTARKREVSYSCPDRDGKDWSAEIPAVPLSRNSPTTASLKA